jgi:hypothetical protein
MLPYNRGNRRRWCSEACRVRTFRTARPDYVEQNKRASAVAGRRRILTAGLSRCRVCAVVVQGNGRRYCDDHRPNVGNTVDLTRSCPVCSTDFTTSHQGQRYCSIVCRGRAAIRRRPIRNRRFPGFTPAQRRRVATRDGWRCGFCHALIDRQLRWPHPGSLSIDHIDPDGAHEPANWQASHLACNVQAGAKKAAA